MNDDSMIITEKKERLNYLYRLGQILKSGFFGKSVKFLEETLMNPKPNIEKLNQDTSGMFNNETINFLINQKDDNPLNESFFSQLINENHNLKDRIKTVEGQLFKLKSHHSDQHNKIKRNEMFTKNKKSFEIEYSNEENNYAREEYDRKLGLVSIRNDYEIKVTELFETVNTILKEMSLNNNHEDIETLLNIYSQILRHVEETGFMLIGVQNEIKLNFSKKNKRRLSPFGSNISVNEKNENQELLNTTIINTNTSELLKKQILSFPAKGKFFIKLEGAYEIQKVEGDYSDAYCLIDFKKEQRYSKTNSTANPTWHEIFEYDVEFENPEHIQNLHIEIWDSNTITHDVFLGEIKIDSMEMLKYLEKHGLWNKISKTLGNISGKKLNFPSVTGYLIIELLFLYDKTVATFDGNQVDSDELTELPTEYFPIEGNLYFEISKAKNLVCIENAGTSKEYSKAYTIVYYKEEKFNTQVVSNKNPEWNEQFQTKILLKNKYDLPKIKFEIWHDAFFGDSFLGEATLANFLKLIKNPGKWIEFILKLSDFEKKSKFTIQGTLVIRMLLHPSLNYIIPSMPEAKKSILKLESKKTFEKNNEISINLPIFGSLSVFIKNIKNLKTESSNPYLIDFNQIDIDNYYLIINVGKTQKKTKSFKGNNNININTDNEDETIGEIYFDIEFTKDELNVQEDLNKSVSKSLHQFSNK